MFLISMLCVNMWGHLNYSPNKGVVAIRILRIIHSLKHSTYVVIFAFYRTFCEHACFRMPNLAQILPFYLNLRTVRRILQNVASPNMPYAAWIGRGMRNSTAHRRRPKSWNIVADWQAFKLHVSATQSLFIASLPNYDPHYALIKFYLRQWDLSLRNN